MISDGLFGEIKNVGFDHILIVFVVKVVAIGFTKQNIDYDITNWIYVEMVWLLSRAL